MKNTYLGLFFTSLAALMLEILLTRVLSVATWYYFAFFAISVAMFGFTLGALTVYLKKESFEGEKLYTKLTAFALVFGVSVDIALMIFLSVPFYPRFTGTGIFSTIFIYLVLAFPFLCAGVVVCLCLTRFPEKTGLLYAADLIGAGVGAFMVFPVLNAMDAPSAIMLAGAVGALGAIFFSKTISGARAEGLKKGVAGAFLLLTAFTLVNAVFQPVKLEWVKTKFNRPEVESWNAFSRIAVYPLNYVKSPYSWGLSTAYKPQKRVGERMIDIDGISETVMTMYDGKAGSAPHLKYDVTSIAHYMRDNAKVFIIGVGGGRDILAAREFNQKEIVGAEINDRTLELINGPFGNFTGHLDKLPNVRIINDEARSVITRSDERFDIIQASCIATWSATTAGAFSLAENSLYTVEAWETFMGRLTDNGILSFNRWYSPDFPAQLLRLASLASYTLKMQGVADPGRHIAVVRSDMPGKMPSATILIGKSAFTGPDIERLRAAVTALDFKFVYDPAGYQDQMFKEVIEKAGDERFYASIPLDLSPSTDDRPFFFYTLRIKDLLEGKNFKFREQWFSAEGVTMLLVLMVVSVFLCAAFIFGPLLFAKRRAPLPTGGGAVGLLFFGSIGFGYILIEIAQLQRLIIFLGHPVYSITVVIFAMLLSSGVGSVASGLWTRGGGLKASHIAVLMAALITLLGLTLYFQPGILAGFERNGIGARIALSLIFLVPLGFLMGLPFPFGMSLASKSFKEHTPWFWAANGATSVVSSVLSVCISITWGFTATMAAGLAFYAVAAIALLLFLSVSRQRV